MITDSTGGEAGAVAVTAMGAGDGAVAVTGSTGEAIGATQGAGAEAVDEITGAVPGAMEEVAVVRTLVTAVTPGDGAGLDRGAEADPAKRKWAR